MSRSLLALWKLGGGYFGGGRRPVLGLEEGIEDA
jgi:hypothetical protein